MKMSKAQTVLSSSVVEQFEVTEFPPEASPASAPAMVQTTANAREPEPWPSIDDAAYHGLASDFVKTIEPHTESDPAGLLIQFLVAFGNIVGNSPYYLVEANSHHANLFAVLVGNRSRGAQRNQLGPRARHSASR